MKKFLMKENSIKYNNILINETSNFKVEEFYIEPIHKEQE